MAQTTRAKAGSDTARAPDADTDKVTDGTGDRLSHLVCFLCFPAFDGALKAPHDASCLCGKPVRRGEVPGEPGSQACVVCDQLWIDHRALTHGRPRP
jgi:hypothetical protein